MMVYPVYVDIACFLVSQDHKQEDCIYPVTKQSSQRERPTPRGRHHPPEQCRVLPVVHRLHNQVFATNLPNTQARPRWFLEYDCASWTDHGELTSVTYTSGPDFCVLLSDIRGQIPT